MYLTAGREAITTLLHNLREGGYIVVGPSLSEGVVRLREITEPGDLASGVLDSQAPGKYTVSTGSPFVFSSVNGPDSPKRYLHPAVAEVLRIVEGAQGIEVIPIPRSKKRYAFIGIRPCDLRGVEVMDATMMVPGFEDPVYSSLREDCLFIVVNCTRAGKNCFCASMGTGPKSESGYDLAITELPEKLLFDVPDGNRALLRGIKLDPASENDLRAAEQMIHRAREEMGLRFDREGASKQILSERNSAVWERTAERCLACGNCTMVCPTCFCNTIEERNDVTDGSVSRVRVWDSCLSKDFTYSAGGNPRQRRSARYRQFVTHKFGYWPEQFGHFGCVGCGRCITWCPVGIDITETVNAVVKGHVAAGKGGREAQIV